MDVNTTWQSFAPLPDELAGQVIAITGANGGLGRALAVAAGKLGAEMLLLGRNVKQLETVHAEIETAGGRASIAALDLEHALANDYDAVAAAIETRYGRLDGLIHCAAQLGSLAPIEQYDVPAWYRVMHINVTAAFALTQALLALLRCAPAASLVFTSCEMALTPRAYWGAYAASKAAVENLAGVLADELESAGRVRVNIVDPGRMRSRLRRAAFPSEDVNALPDPATCLQPYLWLLSANSRAVTGCRLQVPAV